MFSQFLIIPGKMIVNMFIENPYFEDISLVNLIDSRENLNLNI